MGPKVLWPLVTEPGPKPTSTLFLFPDAAFRCSLIQGTHWLSGPHGSGSPGLETLGYLGMFAFSMPWRVGQLKGWHQACQQSRVGVLLLPQTSPNGRSHTAPTDVQA